jgi:hypothetical protein
MWVALALKRSDDKEKPLCQCAEPGEVREAVLVPFPNGCFCTPLVASFFYSDNSPSERHSR